MQKIKAKLSNMLVAIVAVMGLSAPVLAPAAVFAQTNDDLVQGGLCAGANLDVTDRNCDPTDPEAESRVQEIIELVINIFSLVVGVVAVIMIIVGGLKYITSGGDSGNVTGAKNTILYAVIGLVVVALAQVIVRFVLNRATE